MKRLKIGLNGFGRIGRSFMRIAALRDSFDIVMINTRKTPSSMLAYLLKYDSVYRIFEKEVKAETDGITVNGKKIITTQITEPGQIPWDAHEVDVVVDATGAFENKEDLQKHIKGSVRKVILTAPSKTNDMEHIVLGVNDKTFDFTSSQILSNCSCTTNCAALLVKVLDDNFRVLSGFLTTTHAYTSTQEILDDPSGRKERSRAAPTNIVPSTTGAAEAVVRTMPHLEGRFDGMSIRVPVPIVSFANIYAVVEKPATIEQINNSFKNAEQGELKGILKYEEEVLVSSDYIGSSYSAVYDANYTRVLNNNIVQICGWYDNEWGYSTRLVDLIEKLASHF